MTSTITHIRIVSPASRVREHAGVDDLVEGDIIEIVDRPVYRVDPRTWKATTVLQRFTVGAHRSLSINRPDNRT